MTTTVSDFVIQRMQEGGAGRVFAFPGDGIRELDGALGKAPRASGTDAGA